MGGGWDEGRCCWSDVSGCGDAGGPATLAAPTCRMPRRSLSRPSSAARAPRCWRASAARWRVGGRMSVRQPVSRGGGPRGGWCQGTLVGWLEGRVRALGGCRAVCIARSCAGPAHGWAGPKLGRMGCVGAVWSGLAAAWPPPKQASGRVGLSGARAGARAPSVSAVAWARTWSAVASSVGCLAPCGLGIHRATAEPAAGCPSHPYEVAAAARRAGAAAWADGKRSRRCSRRMTVTGCVWAGCGCVVWCSSASSAVGCVGVGVGVGVVAGVHAYAGVGVLVGANGVGGGDCPGGSSLSDPLSPPLLCGPTLLSAPLSASRRSAVRLVLPTTCCRAAPSPWALADARCGEVGRRPYCLRTSGQRGAVRMYSRCFSLHASKTRRIRHGSIGLSILQRSHFPWAPSLQSKPKARKPHWTR